MNNSRLAAKVLTLQNLFASPSAEGSHSGPQSYYADDEGKTIHVPVGTVEEIDQDVPDPNDQLMRELMTLQQESKTIAILGSRNIPLPHQNLIEMLAFTLVSQGNIIVTSGGSSGTNAAAIRGAMKADATKLKVVLPQMIGHQPPDVQDQLIGIPTIIEHPEWQMMPLADASRLCNREVVDECDQLLIFLFHDSNTYRTAIEYAEDKHKIITALYLD